MSCSACEDAMRRAKAQGLRGEFVCYDHAAVDLDDYFRRNPISPELAGADLDEGSDDE